MKSDSKKISCQRGFTLLELLAVISIIGFIASGTVVALNLARIQSRDSQRATHMTAFSKALAMYQNDYGGFPESTGECLDPSMGAGLALVSAKLITLFPKDPSWPNTIPSVVLDGHADGASENFCYYYASDKKNYNISYFLEGNTKVGQPGIHIMGPAGSK